MSFRVLVVVLGCVSFLGTTGIAADLKPALSVLQSVDREGKADGDPKAAWSIVNGAKPQDLPTLLAALDDAKPLGANWIRAAIDSVAEKAIAQKTELPRAELKAFILDRSHVPRARRLAYEWLSRADAAEAEKLISQLLDDPSVELRRDAVARQIDAAKRQLEKEEKDQASDTFRRALKHARDLDQVQLVAGELRKLGETVDLARHFGFLTDWQVIGPFDNSGRKGFALEYPPETEFDTAASYPGKQGDVRWKPVSTSDEFGNVDLNKELVTEKSVVAYARAEVLSDVEQPAELRLGSLNATKVWLNGELVADNEVYHALTKMDQYTGRGVLKPGKNVILVKICQNEQTEEWAVDWKFQLRVCDATGTAIGSQPRSGALKQAAAKSGETK